MWLSSDRPYAEGLDLYLRYGRNEFLKKRFQHIQDDYNKKKIAEELNKMLGESRNSLPTKTERAISHPSCEDEHAKYLSLLNKRDEVVKQIERNMAVLDLSTAKHILFETAKQILKLHQKKTELWAAIDFYQQQGCFKHAVEAKPLPKEKEIQLLYQAISKAKKRLQGDHCRNKNRTQQLLDQHLQRLNELKAVP